MPLRNNRGRSSTFRGGTSSVRPSPLKVSGRQDTSGDERDHNDSGQSSRPRALTIAYINRPVKSVNQRLATRSHSGLNCLQPRTTGL
jgi:hypothetical protein